MKLRSFLVRPGLEEKIAQYKKEGKELVAVDDWMLESHKWLKSRISKVYVVRRDYLNRREGLKTRSALTTEELKVWDMPYARGFVREPKDATVIQNNSTLGRLRAKAQKVYERYVQPTFDERYNVTERDLSPIRESKKEYSKEEKNKGEKV